MRFLTLGIVYNFRFGKVAMNDKQNVLGSLNTPFSSTVQRQQFMFKLSIIKITYKLQKMALHF